MATQKASPSTITDEFSKIVDASRRIQALPRNKQVKALASMQAALAKLAAVTPPIQKRSVEIAYNSTRALSEGLAGNEAGATEVKDYMKEMGAVHATLKDKAAAAVDREVRKQRTSSMTRIDVQVADLSEDATKVFQRYNKFNALVPAQTNKKFVGIKIPVVPITDPPMFGDKLQRLGMSTDSVFGYPILVDQNVLGINKTWVDQIVDDPERDKPKKGGPDPITSALHECL